VPREVKGNVFAPRVGITEGASSKGKSRCSRRSGRTGNSARLRQRIDPSLDGALSITCSGELSQARESRQEQCGSTQRD